MNDASVRAQLERPYDVAIAGAGHAGSALAGMCARKGLRVVCIDRRPLGESGARWVNDAPPWMFDEAGIARPTGAELLHEGGDMLLYPGRVRSPRVIVRDQPLIAVDMRALTARLQNEALESGAVLLGSVDVRGMDDGVLVTAHGRIRARFAVDASGLAGVRGLEREPVDPQDVCVAAQRVFEIASEPDAHAYMEAHGAREGDVMAFLGVAGGYSVLNVRVHEGRAYVLTGSIPAEGQPSGSAMIDRFIAEQRWISREIFGGSRAIPLSQPRRFAHANTAAIGDAARQVFAAHGSGTGSSLIAARMLTDVIADGRRPEAYARAWHERFGATHALYDGLRRFSQSIGPEEVGALMDAGIVSAESTRAALLERPFVPPADAVLRIARASVRFPALARALARAVTGAALPFARVSVAGLVPSRNA